MPYSPDSPGSPEVAAERTWSYERLKDLAAESCRSDVFRPGLVSFDALPETVHFGKFGDKAVECVSETHRDGRERGTVFRFNPKTGKPEIQKGLFEGTEQNVLLWFRNEQLRDQRELLEAKGDAAADFLSAHSMMGNRDRKVDMQAEMRANNALGRTIRRLHARMIGSVHSHPTENPFSDIDIAAFLRDPLKLFDVLGTTDGTVHALLATHETEWISPDASDAKAKHWYKLLVDRMAEAEKTDLRRRPANEVFAEIQRTLIRSIARKYKFAYYVGKAGGPLERQK